MKAMKIESKEDISTLLLNKKIENEPMKSELHIHGPVLKTELKIERVQKQAELDPLIKCNDCDKRFLLKYFD